MVYQVRIIISSQTHFDSHCLFRSDLLSLLATTRPFEISSKSFDPPILLQSESSLPGQCSMRHTNASSWTSTNSSYRREGQGCKLTLVTDGWTDVRGESIINYLLVAASGRAIFHSSNCSGSDRHTSEYLSAEICKIVEEVGPEKINAICTNTTSNIKKAVSLVVEKHDHIYQIGCN